MNNHRIATWIGTLGLLVAVLLPVLDRLQGLETDPVMVGILAVVAVLFVGSQRVVKLLTRLLEASKWGADE